MGQQPNIELNLTDAPRSKLGPGVARRWKPRRPAELRGPAEVPNGAQFGTIGPDAGYALKLVAEHDLDLLPGEHHHDVAAALAAIATSRAAKAGRAPVADDVTVAMIILGLDTTAPVDAGLLAARPGWIANVGHNDAKLRRIVADVPIDVLALTPVEVAAKVGSGWAFRV